MSYTPDELQRAGTQLAEYMRQLQSRVEQVENKPTLDALNDQWQQGRQIARAKGYDDHAIEKLESFMVRRGIQHHQDALAIDPSPPTWRPAAMGGVRPDALKLLLDGDESAFLSIAIPAALDDVR